MHHLMFITICLIWGTSFYLMRLAAPAFGPIAIGAWRVVGGAVCLGVIWLVMRKPWPLRRTHLGAVLLVTLCGYISPFVVQPYLIGTYDNSSFFGMMVSAVPLLTILVSIPLLRIYPSPRQLIGVMGGLACMLLLFRESLALNITVGHFCLALVVPLSYAMSNTLVKRFFHHIPPIAVVLSTTTLASIVLLPLSVAIEPVHTTVNGFGWIIVWLALLGLVGTGLATWMFYKIIQARGPLYAGMVTYVVPMGALAWGWVGDEKITPYQLVALIGIFAMVALVQSSPTPRHVEDATPIAPEFDGEDETGNEPAR